MREDTGVAIKLALAGDTMLGRGVADRLATSSPESLFAPEIVEIANEADLFILNLECCVSERGTRWSAPGKAFFFRAPASAAEALALLGVDCVSLANNHALDFGEEALQDTFDHLARVGIAWAGAGADVDQARAPAVLAAGAFRLGVLSLCDHPQDFAAGPGRPGVAFADLERGVPDWGRSAVRSVEADAVLVSPHWGPNGCPPPSLMSGGLPEPWWGREPRWWPVIRPTCSTASRDACCSISAASSTTTPSIRSSGTIWGSCGSSRWTRVGPASLRPCR